MLRRNLEGNGDLIDGPIFISLRIARPKGWVRS